MSNNAAVNDADTPNEIANGILLHFPWHWRKYIRWAQISVKTLCGIWRYRNLFQKIFLLCLTFVPSIWVCKLKVLFQFQLASFFAACMCVSASANDGCCNLLDGHFSFWLPAADNTHNVSFYKLFPMSTFELVQNYRQIGYIGCI